MVVKRVDWIRNLKPFHFRLFLAKQSLPESFKAVKLYVEALSRYLKNLRVVGLASQFTESVSFAEWRPEGEE